METTLNQRNNERNIRDISQGSKKPKLTVKSMGEMIIDKMDKSAEDILKSRLFQPKRQLINYLFNGIGYLSETQLDNQLTSAPWDKEDNLMLYTFFLSQTEQFNFEWSYLISKHRNIHDFLRRFNKFINFVCNDINEMIASIQLSDQTLFQVDEFLQIIYSPSKNSLYVGCELDLIRNILSCNADKYRLKIICGSKTIVSLDRFSKEDRIIAINKIQTLLAIFDNTKHSKEGSHEEK